MQKTTYIIILIFFTIGGYAQDPIIAINDAGDTQSFFGPEQLIDEVLINSTCSTIRDFTQQVFGAPTDTNIKSYGYFKRAGGTTFPFEEGIVISSGKAFEGGNSIDTATVGGCAGCGLGLSGDADLDVALSSTEISEDSITIPDTLLMVTFVNSEPTVTGASPVIETSSIFHPP